MKKIFFFVSVFLLLYCVGTYAAVEVSLSDLKISPEKVEAGQELEVSFSLSITNGLPDGSFIFFHLEGPGPGRYLNADMSLPKISSPSGSGSYGPFHISIPQALPDGDYKVIMGIAYPKTVAGKAVYIKIPYVNPDISGWWVGTVRVEPRKSVSPNPEADYNISVVGPLVKVFPERGSFSAEMNTSFDVSCARNETESLQVVLIPEKTGLSDITLEVSDFADSKNESFIAKDNISLFRVGYVKTSKPYYNTPRVGLWPDPLFVFKPGIRVDKGSVQPIWVNITVPANAKSTDYTAYITVRPKGLEPRSVKLNLRVRDFSLPKDTHLKTAFDFYEYLVDMRYPKREYETSRQYKTRLDKIKTAIYLDMLRHRLNPIHNVGNPVFLGNHNGVYTLDFVEFDRKVEFYKKYGQTVFGIAQEWPQGYNGEWTNAWYGFSGPQALEGVFKEYAKHLEERGWLADAFAYIFDETLNKVREVTGLIHKANPGIKNLVTMPPEEGYPDVDIWCVRINNLDNLSVKKFLRQNKEIWVYVAGPSFPYPSLNLDFLSVHYRIIPWICWKYKLSGFLYWCVNYWHNVNPLEDPMTYPEQNGNGCLYYPDPEGESFVGSIRLEVLRDGIEDFEYLYLLKEKLKQMEYSIASDNILLEEIQDALELPDSVVRSSAYYASEPNRISGMREKIAQLIEDTDEP